MASIKTRLLVDTCVIIEAVRTSCWKALCAHFSVETVERCVEECRTGDPARADRVNVTDDDLALLAVKHPVTAVMLANMTLSFEDLPALDAGEHHLLAWLHAHRTEPVRTLLSTADAAAVRAADVMKLLNQVHSLQSAAGEAHVGRKQLNRLKHNYTEQWLSSVRTQLAMTHL